MFAVFLYFAYLAHSRSHDRAMSPGSPAQPELSRRHTRQEGDENMSTPTKPSIVFWYRWAPAAAPERLANKPVNFGYRHLGLACL
jgi:hypothetical protein